MFHLRRIHFYNLVCGEEEHTKCARGTSNGNGLTTIMANRKKQPAINDAYEPSQDPAVRCNSTYILLTEETKFGRNPDKVDVVLQMNSPSAEPNMISRFHSVIYIKNGRYYIEDKSLNGTYVNDVRVGVESAKEKIQLLHEGDIIKFGNINGAALKAGERALGTADFTFKLEQAIPGYAYFGHDKNGKRKSLDSPKPRAFMQIDSKAIQPFEVPSSVVQDTQQQQLLFKQQPNFVLGSVAVAAPPVTSTAAPPTVLGITPHFVLASGGGKTAQYQQIATHSVQQSAAGSSQVPVSIQSHLLAQAQLSGNSHQLPVKTSISAVAHAANQQQQPQLAQQQSAQQAHIQHSKSKQQQNLTSAFSQAQSQAISAQQQHQNQIQTEVTTRSATPVAAVAAAQHHSHQQQQQQLAAAAAMAAAANIANSDEIAAQLRQFMASAAVNTPPTVGAVPSSAISAVVTSDPSLNALNPLLYLSRLPSSSLYNAAAYLGPNLWSNMNLNAWRNVLQNNPTDWIQLNASQRVAALGVNYTAPPSANLSSSTPGNGGTVASATTVAAVIQQQLRASNGNGNIVQVTCAMNCIPSTSTTTFSTVNNSKAFSLPNGQFAGLMNRNAVTVPSSSATVFGTAASFLPSSFVQLTPQQQQELLVAAQQQQQQQLLLQQNQIKKEDSAVCWPLCPSEVVTSSSSQVQIPQNLATVLCQSGIPLSQYAANGLTPSEAIVTASSDVSQQQQQNQRIANALAAIEAGKLQNGGEIYSNLIPTTSTVVVCSTNNNDFLAAAAAAAALSAQRSTSTANTANIRTSGQLPTQSQGLDRLVSSGATSNSSGATQQQLSQVSQLANNVVTLGSASSRIQATQGSSAGLVGGVKSLSVLVEGCTPAGTGSNDGTNASVVASAGSGCSTPSSTCLVSPNSSSTFSASASKASGSSSIIIGHVGDPNGSASIKDLEINMHNATSINSLAAKLFDQHQHNGVSAKPSVSINEHLTLRSTARTPAEKLELQGGKIGFKINGLATLKDAAVSLLSNGNGCTTTTVTSLGNGNRTYDLKHLAAVAKATNIDDTASTMANSTATVFSIITTGTAIDDVVPKAELVKTMECDSSVPSPPKFNDSFTSDVKSESRNSPALSSPSRPCSYQSVPLSPPRAPCPKRMDESDVESRLSEAAPHSPSTDSLSLSRLKNTDLCNNLEQERRESSTTFKSTNKKNERKNGGDEYYHPQRASAHCQQDQEQKEKDDNRNDGDLNCSGNESRDREEKERQKRKNNTRSKLSSSAAAPKRNEVERLLHDLTAGNCSWMYQASRQNAHKRLIDSTGGSAGVKSLRLDERKKRELFKKKSHKLMRQISDESSDDEDGNLAKSARTSGTTACASGTRLDSCAEENGCALTSTDEEDGEEDVHQNSSAKSKMKSSKSSRTNSTKRQHNNLLITTSKQQLQKKKRVKNFSSNKSKDERKNQLRSPVSTSLSKSTKSGNKRKSSEMSRRTSSASQRLAKDGKESSTDNDDENEERNQSTDDEPEPEQKILGSSSAKKSTTPRTPQQSASRFKGILKSGSASTGKSISPSIKKARTSGAGAALTSTPKSSKTTDRTSCLFSKKLSRGAFEFCSSKKLSSFGKSFSSSIGTCAGASRGGLAESGTLIDEWNYHDPERNVCAHAACRKPQDENVNWAACDACDKWFHTLCTLGSNVELDDATDFRCGCRTTSGAAETVPLLNTAIIE